MSINNTPEARLQALRDSRELLTGGGSTSMFGENKAPAPKTTSLIRLSHYIVTGRDYAEREEVPAELLMPPVMLHSGTVASMIERKYPDEVSALTGVIGHANVNALVGSPEFEAIVTQEASSYHNDACAGRTQADLGPAEDGPAPDEEEGRTGGTIPEGIQIHIDSSGDPLGTAAAAARSIAKQRNLL